MLQRHQGIEALLRPRPRLRPHVAAGRRWRSAARPLIFVGLLLALLFVGLTQTDTQPNSRRPLTLQLDDLTVAAGLGINQVSLTGHRFTADGDVFDALRLIEQRSMARFSIKDARARIEALPWVAKASIARVFPDELRVVIKERVPFALWQTGAEHLLIDATGHVLGAVRPGAARHLPLVVGEGAPERAKDFMALVAAYPKIAGAMVAYERVGDRRWTLRLADRAGREFAIQLPEEDPGAALARVTRLERSARLFGRDLAVIDLRNRNRLTLRPAASAGPDSGFAGAAGRAGRS